MRVLPLKLSDMKKGFPGYDSSPRNKASGTAKRYDGEGCEFLTVMFYDIEGDVEHETEHEKFQRLVDFGLVVPPFTVFHTPRLPPPLATPRPSATPPRWPSRSSARAPPARLDPRAPDRRTHWSDR